VLETPFFDGAGPNTQFYCVAQRLAEILARRTKYPPELKGNDPASGDEAIDVRGLLTGTIDVSVNKHRAANSEIAGRKVYLAKPTADTQTEYLRLYKELTSHGFAVVPSPAGDIPFGAAGIQLIDEALKDAIASVHLVGQIQPSGTDLTENVAAIQLNRAEQRVLKQEGGSSGSLPFRRIVWVPRVFSGAERDPIDTLRIFAAQLPSDRIESDTISRFTESLLPYLDTVIRVLPPLHSASDGEIYLCHDERDEDYAFEVANILADLNKDYVMPVYANTSEQERKRFHREHLAKCSSVMMCWANASEYWAKAQAMELADWHSLGRNQQFAHRALIAGPPPNTRKEDKRLRLLFPRKEIDVLLNWAAAEKPLPEAIKDIFAADTNASQ
jgi:hypothetical protein